jgi:lipoprotein-anchoring transpeptidase ErfK/SrfK
VLVPLLVLTGDGSIRCWGLTAWIWNGYALHGTDLPETVGQGGSHSCLRLRNEDVAKLYQMVPVGTPVYLY